MTDEERKAKKAAVARAWYEQKRQDPEWVERERLSREARYRANREATLERQAEYYAANKEARIEYAAVFRAANKEALAKRAAEYYAANKEAIAKRVVKYNKTPAGKEVAARARAKRSRGLGWKLLHPSLFHKDADTDLHHINDIDVVFIPRRLHEQFSGHAREKHRALLAPFVSIFYEHVPGRFHPMGTPFDAPPWAELVEESAQLELAI